MHPRTPRSQPGGAWTRGDVPGGGSESSGTRNVTWRGVEHGLRPTDRPEAAHRRGDRSRTGRLRPRNGGAQGTGLDADANDSRGHGRDRGVAPAEGTPARPRGARPGDRRCGPGILAHPGGKSTWHKRGQDGAIASRTGQMRTSGLRRRKGTIRRACSPPRPVPDRRFACERRRSSDPRAVTAARTGRAGDLWTADLRRRRERRRIVAGPTALTIVGAGRILGRRTTQCRGPVPIPVPGLDPQRDEVGEKAPGVVVELDHGSAILTERFDAAWPTDGRAWRVGQVALTAEYDIKVDA